MARWNRTKCLVKMVGLTLLLGEGIGCQTWVGGMTLPSGKYLQHQPQFFAPSPAFPLSRELAGQEATAAAGIPGAPTTALPPPVVPTPAVTAPAAAPAPAPVPAPVGNPER